jgi:multidrug resistance efflux pump
MSVPRLAGMAVLCAVAFAPASCSKQSANAYQGWVEANLIFVAPDETGRVRTLTVQEGDTVKTGDLLFTVDDDLQQADLAQGKASVKNAQQTVDRASMLVKTGAGTQKDFDAAEMILRDAQARLISVQTRLSRRNVFSAVGGTVQQIYFRPGEMVPAGRPVLSLPLLRAGGGAADRRLRRRNQCHVRWLRERAHSAGELHRQAIRVHAAGYLQSRRTRQARLSDRGVAGKALRVSRRPAGRRDADASSAGDVAEGRGEA